MGEHRLRIGIDATFMEGDSLYTGMGTYTYELVQGMAAHSSEVELTLLGNGERPPSAPTAHRWHRLSPRSQSRWGRRLLHQVATTRAIRRLDLDLYHVPGLNMRISQPGIPLVATCPLVVTVHDAIPLVYYGTRLPRRLRLGFWIGIQAARRADMVITVSETSRADLLRVTPLLPERVMVIHNGAPKMEAPPQAQRDAILDRLNIEPPYLLYAGSYEPRKNLIKAVRAYAEAARSRRLPPLVLLVERESGYRASAMDSIEGLGLGEPIKLIHSLTGAELATVFAEASLLLYPSLYEGFGFPPLQAMALGVPVVASEYGALPEILGQAAHFVDPTSTASISQAIVEVLDDPEHAAGLVAAGERRARGFSWERTVRETVAVYREIARGPAAGALRQRAQGA